MKRGDTAPRQNRHAGERGCPRYIFTLSVPGVHTAIVGTTRPERIQENAAILKAGPLPKDLLEKIRSRWREAADSTWVGQT